MSASGGGKSDRTVDPSGSDCDLREIHISFAERFHNNITVLHIINIQYTCCYT